MRDEKGHSKAPRQELCMDLSDALQIFGQLGCLSQCTGAQHRVAYLAWGVFCSHNYRYSVLL